MIWVETLPGPRIIDIAPVWDDSVSEFNDNELCYIRVNQPPPITLRVSQESRREALKQYTLRLSTTRNEAQDWINPLKDTVYIQYHDNDELRNYCPKLRDFMKDGILKKIRYLAIDIDVALPALEDNTLLSCLAKFKGLRVLTIVMHYEECGDIWRMECTEVEFIMPNLGVLEARSRENLLKDIQDTFDDWKTNQPEWIPPKLELKSITRGGVECCPDE
jgi:hypothetical protein